MTKYEAIETALNALHILMAQECNKNLTPTLKKNCENRRKKFTKAFEILKDLKLDYYKKGGKQ